MLPSSSAPLPPPPADTRPRRRSLLAGTLGVLGALGFTAGCSGGSGDDSGKSPERSAGAVRLRETAAGRSRALLARYDATTGSHSGLAERLAPLRAAVALHAEAFGGRTEKGGGKGERPPGVPGKEKEALAALAEAERRTADSHTASLVDAPPELARLLASVAAAGAAHAYLLGRPDSAEDEGDAA